jgi:hypothetical protein
VLGGLIIGLVETFWSAYFSIFTPGTKPSENEITP